MTTHEYWTLMGSGETYAVELTNDGITGICGPIDWPEYTTTPAADHAFSSNVAVARCFDERGRWMNCPWVNA
jgi:hypothetical protein